MVIYSDIINILSKLEGVHLDGVSSANKLTIKCKYHHVIDMELHEMPYISDGAGLHLLGYFLDGNGNRSQAICSIQTREDAFKFVNLYLTLYELRANKKS